MLQNICENIYWFFDSGTFSTFIFSKGTWKKLTKGTRPPPIWIFTLSLNTLYNLYSKNIRNSIEYIQSSNIFNPRVWIYSKFEYIQFKSLNIFKVRIYSIQKFEYIQSSNMFNLKFWIYSKFEYIQFRILNIFKVWIYWNYEVWIHSKFEYIQSLKFEYIQTSNIRMLKGLNIFNVWTFRCSNIRMIEYMLLHIPSLSP